MPEAERPIFLRLECADQVLLATVDLYTRGGCPMALEPVYRIEGRAEVVRGWRVTVYPPTAPVKGPGSAAGTAP